MPSYSDICISPHSPAKLYAMVLDVEKYSDFLPWCRAARILERHSDYFIGELIVSFSHLTERYSSKVVGVPPSSSAEGSIDVTLVKGPFSHLSNRWRFVALPDGGCEIHFDVDFKFKSGLLEKLIGGVFTRAVEKMSASFMTRADALYGKPA